MSATRLRPLAEPVISGALLILAITWVGTDGYRQDLAVLTVTYGLIGLGLYSHFIMGDSLSIAYNAYAAIGGYALGLVATRTGWPLLVSLPLGIVAAVLISVLLGLATRRLNGFYLAAVTLLFSEAFQAWLIDADGVTGGAEGVILTRSISVFGAELGRDQIVVIALVLMWLIALLLSRLRRSPFGVALRAKAQASVAVEAAGVPVTALTLISLSIGAAIGSLAGAVFTTANLSILPESIPVSVAFLAVFIPFLGGRSSPWGVVIGALLVTELTFNLNFFQGSGTLLFAVAVVAVLIFAPEGLIGLARDLTGRLVGAVNRGGRDER
ncbi:leucine/isoleucine/valine transporter permease subunit [Micromonospora sp. MW-13]|uniref:branched-chain amino acid ABC transporter permease n=1 Tax=Micromonospora sp. MW-13 TaxID=2094022 RepID=UPI000E43E1F4|nr:branched-chain amino acid ABC transporter permease [Micromonospora sp. MW-13]RGC66155.1 leucine/isoleucine/valine transporter permease subunit [Micromonospora sp. MW-13]